MSRMFVAIGVVFAAIGCASKPEPPEQAPDLRAFVAVTGLYSVWATAASPERVEQCAKGCQCNGTGREKTGGGETIAACRCPEACPCKKK